MATVVSASELQDDPNIYDEARTERMAGYYTGIISEVGEDVSREGLVKTPVRAAKAMQYLLKGYREDPEAILRQAMFHEKYQQMVVVKDIEIYSMCEHHMLPFYGHATIGYVPNGRVAGLSKLARTVEVFARRLQLQEQLTAQIADALMEHLAPQGAIVLVEAEHMCMTMRGVQKPGTQTVTLARRGCFEEDPALEERFFRMLGR